MFLFILKYFYWEDYWFTVNTIDTCVKFLNFSAKHSCQSFSNREDKSKFGKAEQRRGAPGTNTVWCFGNLAGLIYSEAL